MTTVSWSRCGDDECVRIGGAGPDAAVVVRPVPAVPVDGLPAMAGRLVRDGHETCFVPRFAFVAGTAYTVEVDGRATVLERPRPVRTATTEVLAIHPDGDEVPRNLLRLSLTFSAPMADGGAATHLRLVDDDTGAELEGVLFPSEYELWDATRRRLTVLLDPARIKRGLAPHRQIGYPLATGRPFRVVVDADWRDATGAPLRAWAQRRYRVGEDERRRVRPETWALDVPSARSDRALVVGFDRPLDHALLARCLWVEDGSGLRVDGSVSVGPAATSWRFTPSPRWGEGPYLLAVDPILEDLAGNSVARVFDRDLTRREDDPGPDGVVRLPFTPSP